MRAAEVMIFYVRIIVKRDIISLWFLHAILLGFALDDILLLGIAKSFKGLIIFHKKVVR